MLGKNKKKFKIHLYTFKNISLAKNQKILKVHVFTYK